MALCWRLAARFQACGPIPALWHKQNATSCQGLPTSGGFEALRPPAAKSCCGAREASFGDLSEGPSQGGNKELLWQKFFSDPSQWWDNRGSKQNSRHPHFEHPDFRHKKSKEALWLNNWCKPAWVESRLAMLDSQVDAGMRRPPGSLSTCVEHRLAAHEGDMDVTICRKLCDNGKISEAVNALDLMVKRRCHIPYTLFYHVLKKCSAENNLVLGRRIHALTVQSGYEGNEFLATHLIGFYASHRRLEEAMGVFTKVRSPDAYNWASIIFAHARHGEPKQAIKLYQRMQQSTVKPSNHIFVAVLNACAAAGDLSAGKDVHAHVRASAVDPNIFVETCLVDMYSKCGSLKEAERVFDSLSQKNVVTWNAMITGYTQQEMGEKALSLYSGMLREGITLPNSVTFVCLLQACASVGVACLHQGKQLHAHIEEQGLQDDVIIGASLVNMYAKCGCIADARKLFDRLPHKDLVTWTAMISGYVQQGMGQDALTVYSSMQQEGITSPNSVTAICLLQACASVGAGGLHQGKQVHAHIKEQGLQDDVVLGATLINMYSNCGSLEDARKVFDGLPQRDVVTWNAMITGYVQQGMSLEAISLYSSMQQKHITLPNSVTCVCLLQACASPTALPQGKQLHAQIEEQGLQDDVVVGASLINMYAKCGSLEDAQKVFDGLSRKNVVTWNAMIAGYSQQGLCHEALSVYSRMQQDGITLPDSVTFVCLLQACASVAALPLGKQLHTQVERRGLQADVAVGPSLVNMYAKCGSLEDAQQVFDSLPGKDIVAWNALIAGYTRQGDSKIVFDLVDRMRLEGTEPNGITLLSLLTVCSHVGLVDKGREYFEAMGTDFGITPTVDHYTCMMDLLGRAGHLDNALQMVKTMPFQANSTMWLTLLGACRKWSNIEVGQQAFEFAVRLDEKDAAAYVLMSNMYAGAGMWEEAKEMQVRRKRLGAWKKQPGQSWWTDMDGVVHSFVVGDRKHPESEGIYSRLERLIPKMKKVGYVPHLESSLRDTADEEKEAELSGHSEKLAIAYALNKTPEGTTIRIAKNLRVCVDCHRATAYISKVEKRTIICRDSSRFHVYTDGKCSCGDYW